MRDPLERIRVVSDDQGTSAGAAQRLRDRQIISTRNPGIQRADTQAPDALDFFGRPKYSKEAAAHERRMARIYRDGQAAAYTFMVGTAVAYTAISTGMRFARGVQDRLDEEAPGSLAATFGEILIGDQLGQVRGLATDVMGDFKSRTLRS